jgi:hypothetical protein
MLFTSWVISTFENDVFLAILTVALSGSKPSGHKQMKFKGIIDARFNQELTILFPSPT